MKLYLFLICLGILPIFKDNSETIIYFEEYNKLENINPQLQKYIQEIKSDSAIEIFHIGDSHIQIGEFSKGFLSGLYKNKIEVENGWYLPNLIFQDLPLQKDNLKHICASFLGENITQMNKTLNIGLTGRAFHFDEKEAILKFKFIEKVSTVEFFHSQSSSVSFESNQPYFVKSNNISENLIVTEVHFKKSHLQFKIHIKNPEKEPLEFYAIKNGFKKKGVYYSNFGVSGATFQDFEFTPNFYAQLIALKPKILIITLGTNDSYKNELDQSFFSSELTSFIKKIKVNSPKTELIFMNTPDTYYENKNPPNSDFVNSEIERISKEQNCAFWNWNKIMGGKGSIQLWKEKGLTNNDLLHFSSDGYFLLGKLFSQAILN